MVTQRVLCTLAVVGIVALFGAMTATTPVFAQEHEEGAVVEGEAGLGDGLRVLGLGIGAGLAVGLAGLGTGRAQAGVGAGGTGAMAEKPELFTNVLILFAIPETIVILGFVIAFFLFNAIG